MMIIITGPPGTGKTTVTKILKNKINAKLISINSLLESYDLTLGTDEVRGYKIVDTIEMIPIVNKIRKECGDNLLIFEGHLAQDYPSSDMVVVLRCNPDILKKRLDSRNWPEKKVKENVSAEILGVCTSESYETYGDIVQEVETSNLTPDEVADILIDIINKKVEYPLGIIDYLGDYFTYLD